ncbi:hypothetical protein AAC387_Pa07g0556 [Persea americana]
MKLDADPKRKDTGLGLTSWRSPSDPSPGNFSFRIDPQTLPQVVIWDGTDLHWRSGPWDGRAFLGVPAMDEYYMYLNGGEWNGGNWSAGCVRSKQLECEKNGNGSWKRDGFLKMEKIKVPDLPVSLAVGSLTECEEKCQKNCSCVAYAYDNMIGCMIWGGDLMDIQQSAKGGVDFNIRLPASELEHKENHNNKDKGMLHFNLHKKVKPSNDSSDGSSTLNDGEDGMEVGEYLSVEHPLESEQPAPLMGEKPYAPECTNKQLCMLYQVHRCQHYLLNCYLVCQEARLHKLTCSPERKWHNSPILRLICISFARYNFEKRHSIAVNICLCYYR